MTGTTRLYYDDPFLLTFSARVVAHGSWEGTPTVVLDRTAFYPESGGQMADRGALFDLPIADVQVDEGGVVHHRLDGPLPPIGAEGHGSIDRARRRVHMALHTGQHMLSRALEDVARAATVSSRLGESGCTIDVDTATLDEAAVARAEDLVNAVIDDDAPIVASFPSEAELATLPLRRKPKVTENIRVVSIGDFDVSPCGGTHCLRTAQVGFVRVANVERYKGKMRVVFSAGARARGEVFGEAGVLRALGKQFTCGPDHVPLAVDKLRRELDASRHALGKARSRVADAVAIELSERARSSTEPVVFVLDDAPIELLRHVASRVTEMPKAVALLAGRTEDGMAILASRGSASTFECGAFLKRAAQAAGGRGGGRAEHAEGRVPKETDWIAIATAAISV